MWAVIFVYFPVTFLNSPVQAYENPRLSKQDASKQEKISINSNNFKSKSPLFITLHPQQITLQEEETNRLKEWINNASLSGQNIHIYSYRYEYFVLIGMHYLSIPLIYSSLLPVR